MKRLDDFGTQAHNANKQNFEMQETKIKNFMQEMKVSVNTERQRMLECISTFRVPNTSQGCVSIANP